MAKSTSSAGGKGKAAAAKKPGKKAASNPAVKADKQVAKQPPAAKVQKAQAAAPAKKSAATKQPPAAKVQKAQAATPARKPATTQRSTVPAKQSVAAKSSGKKTNAAFRSVAKMPIQKVQANGVELVYQDYGDADHPAVLLIMGLGAQLVHWPDKMVKVLLKRGFRVIRFDNRDAGQSQQMPQSGIPWPLPLRILLARVGIRLPAGYSIESMAADTVGLMDELEIGKAHLVGASMGGMIAQAAAIHYAHRVASLTSIMSTTGAIRLPQADNDLIRLLLQPLPTARAAAVAASAEIWRALGGDDYPADMDELQAIAELAFDRSPGPEGMRRQVEAIVSSPPRTHRLASVYAPSLVIHGTKDRLVKPEGGRHTAACIPGARLEMVEGMGHALQPGVIDAILPMIADHIQAAVAR